MGNRGVLLYVDLGKLEDEPYRLSKIYDTLGQYIDEMCIRDRSWFDEPGGGIQYLLPDTVDELLDAGILRRIQ